MTNSIWKELLAEFLGSLPKGRSRPCSADIDELEPPLNPSTGFPLIGPGFDIDEGGHVLGDPLKKPE